MKNNKVFFTVAMLLIIMIFGTVITEIPSIKYGKSAVIEGEKSLFITDRYLDGIITKNEMKKQIEIYDRYSSLSFSDKSRDIYFEITNISLCLSDAEVYEHRNILAGMLHTKRR